MIITTHSKSLYLAMSTKFHFTVTCFGCFLTLLILAIMACHSLQNLSCVSAVNSLQEENRILRNKLSTAVRNNAALQSTINMLERKVKRLKQQLQQQRSVPAPDKLCVDSVKNSFIPGLFRFYTGFVYKTFFAIFSVLVPAQLTSPPFKFTRNLPSLTQVSLQDQLFLVLIRLRCAFTFKDLAFRSGVSPQDLSVMCTSWINYMFFAFGSVSIWPHRDIICSKMPPKFRAKFPNTIAIIDATEIRLQRPSSLVCQSQSYSDYKSTNTFKALIAIDPRGSVMFISQLFSGSISDNRLTHDSGLLTLLGNYITAGLLHENDCILADKGFTNFNDFANLGLKLNTPPMARSQGQMSASDVVSTRTIAAHRVHVERAIGRIKNFKILSQQVMIANVTSLNQIWLVCSYLTNFMPFLVGD
jgi:cell division protein FtsB